MSASALFSHLKAPSHQIKYPLRNLKPLIGLFGLAIQLPTANNDTYMSRSILTYSLYCNSNYNGINLVTLFYHPITQNKRKMLKSGTPHIQTN